MTLSRIAIIFFAGSLLVACETLNPPAPGKDPEYAPTYPLEPDVNKPRFVNGAIYSYETALPLFETPRARHAGDIITVFLVEKTDAKKNAVTRQTKNDQIQSVNTEFFGRPIHLGGGYTMDFNLNTQRTFDGEGQATQNNQLFGKLSVTVSKVLGNGSMLVQGEKWIRINQGNEFVRLSGLIRPQDITPDNTIGSDRIANAKISYGGTGQMNNANAQGWFSRIIWGPLWPE